MNIAQLVFNGISVGSIIALAAVGLTLTIGILRLSNFAHGDLMTLGAYLTWFFQTQVLTWLCETLGLQWLCQTPDLTWLDSWPKLKVMFSIILPMIIPMIVGAIGTIIAMLMAEYLLWKPMRTKRANTTTLTVISIGLALFVRNAILLIWGSSNQNYDLPLVEAMDFGGLKVSYGQFIVIILTIIAIVSLHFLLQNTKIGKAMRALADNIDLARVSGINVDQVIVVTWIITAIVTAFGGEMYGLISAVRPNMGWFLILPMFASVILGGIGNPYGAIAGGLIIGIAQELSVPWLGSEYKLGIALLIMVVILLFRPQGLFSK